MSSGHRVLFFLASLLALPVLQSGPAFPTELQSGTGGASGWTAGSCPDEDLDTWHDCTVPGCDSTGLTCGDCDDSDGAVHPGVADGCDHTDNDCDGAVDEGYPWLPAAEKVLDPGRASGHEHGTALAAIGDVNGDSVPDFVAGSPKNGTGRVVLYSGADRSVICRTTAGASGEQIGATVAGIGDVTGDGVPEILAGAPGASVWNSHAGVSFAFTYSAVSETCGVLFELHDPDAAGGDYLGYSLAGIGDVTGDAFPDIAVGEPGDSSRVETNGAVLVFSGADGSFFRRMVDPNAGWRDHLATRSERCGT